MSEQALAPIRTTPFFVNLTAQGTTATRVLLQTQNPNGTTFLNADGVYPTVFRVRILNLHATNQVAVSVTARTLGTLTQQVYNSTSGGTAASPTTPVGGTAGLPVAMTCGVAGALGAADGIRVLPGTALELVLGAAEMLWVVASAASTPIQVVWFAQ